MCPPKKKGWDVESRDTSTGHLRFISEVKGRHTDARDVIVTKNEILASLNAPDAFHLALVTVENGFAHQPVYVQRFFHRELGFAEDRNRVQPGRSSVAGVISAA